MQYSENAVLSQPAVSGELSSPSRLLARDRGRLRRAGRVEDSCQEGRTG